MLLPAPSLGRWPYCSLEGNVFLRRKAGFLFSRLRLVLKLPSDLALMRGPQVCFGILNFLVCIFFYPW